jgi:hypothetical protein
MGLVPSKKEDYKTFYNNKDEEHWNTLEKLVSNNISIKELMIHFSAFIRRRDLPKLLCHYELFKMVKDLPGSIVELGVYLGAGMFTFGNLLETFVPGDRSRKVYGFDNFTGYDGLTEKDGNPQPWISSITGEKKTKFEFVQELVELHNNDNLIPGVKRVQLINGDINLTVPDFVKNNQGTRISLLYFDVNLFEPTLTGLKYLYPLVIPGGIIAFNGYGAPPWEGEAKAIESFFSDLGKQPIMEKFPHSTHPSAYFIKE